MKSKKGYVFAGGVGLLLLFALMAIHSWLAYGEGVVSSEHKSGADDKYISYNMESVNGDNYLVIKGTNVIPEFVDSVAPNISDSDIVLAVAAAFTGERLDYYKPFNIGGNYVVKGIAKKGFSSKYCTGYFAAFGDGFHIGSNMDEINGKGKAILYHKQKAIDSKSSYFQQLLLVHNGMITDYIPFTKENQYRALCEKDGELLIVQSLDKVTCRDFSEALVVLGVNNALYLDMGSWAWGWFRENNGSLYELSYRFPETRYQTNWIVFRKRK
ncbi:MAG: hypothetical protein J6K74_05710 [Marinifilaceae bacterium]|nr:hypothetical protein [Marinifilaceae bacterium]